MNTQTNQLFNTHLGYEIPDEISEFGLKEEYVAVMEKARTLYEPSKSLLRKPSRHPIHGNPWGLLGP